MGPFSISFIKRRAVFLTRRTHGDLSQERRRRRAPKILFGHTVCAG
jgi:hypothetical protein